MRVIAGRYRSRPLRSLHGMDIRPTSDRLRETLFNSLCAGNPVALEGTVWLDLFAGTGAIGIEALSRGATQVYFVESSAAAVDLIRKNLNSLAINTGFHILRQEIPLALRHMEREQVAADVVFIDPPYHLKNAYPETLLALAQSSVISATSVVIAEHEKQFDPGESFGPLGRFRKLVQGGATLTFYRIISAAEIGK
jgi:16S rRNA (guanine966-N2)-methyltransferase